MAFTAPEKARIRHHLSYPSWTSLSASIQLGFPSGSQPLFLLEQAFGRLLPDGEAAVRVDLCECEDIETQLRDARSRMKAKQLGELHTNPNETRQLRVELQFWRQRLADDLGVVRDPYSQAAWEGDGGSVSGRRVSAE